MFKWCFLIICIITNLFRLEVSILSSTGAHPYHILFSNYRESLHISFSVVSRNSLGMLLLIWLMRMAMFLLCPSVCSSAVNALRLKDLMLCESENLVLLILLLSLFVNYLKVAALSGVSLNSYQIRKIKF